MTTYRLRDRELQQKLDEISGGCFTEALESIKKPSCIVFQARNGGPAMSVNLTKQDIEQFLEYNPNDWNVFPDVTPPEGVMMRCIIKTPGRNLDGPEPELPKICARTSGVWDGRRWQFFGYGSLCEGSTVEYRTWE